MTHLLTLRDCRPIEEMARVCVRRVWRERWQKLRWRYKGEPQGRKLEEVGTPLKERGDKSPCARMGQPDGEEETRVVWSRASLALVKHWSLS